MSSQQTNGELNHAFDSLQLTREKLEAGQPLLMAELLETQWALEYLRTEFDEKPTNGVNGEDVLEITPQEIPQELIEKAPGVIKPYINWYLETARNPEPVYALASALAFFTAAIGPRRHIENVWLNFGCLTVGPTESGKEYIMAAANSALHAVSQQTSDQYAVAVPSFDRHFGSEQGIWWALHDDGPVVLFDTELGRLLEQSNQIGTLTSGIVRAMLILHDSVAYERVKEVRYSGRGGQKAAAKEMTPLTNPFLGIHGTATPRFYENAKGMAAEDGSLNRLILLNCQGSATKRCREKKAPIPDSLISFFQDLPHPQQELTYESGAEELLSGFDMKVHPQVEHSPGTYGRFGIKSARLALLAAVVRGSDIVSKEDITWACSIIAAASGAVTSKFEEAGGLAYSECDALERAILAAFNSPSVTSNDGKLTKGRLHQVCRKWKESDFLMRERALKSLESSGFMTAVSNGWTRST